MMKFRSLTQICVVLCLSLMATTATLFAADTTTSAKAPGAKSAYNKLAPYVNSDTFLVVRVDCASIDPEKISATLSDIFTGYMKERKFEKDSINATNREFKKTLATIKDDLTQMTSIFELGLQEIYVVMQQQRDTFRIVVPVAASMPEAQRDMIKQLASAQLSDNFKAIDVQNGIAFAYNKELDADVYKTFKSGANDRLKGYLANSVGATVQIYVSGLKVKKYMSSSQDDAFSLNEIVSNTPKEFQKGLDSFEQYFQCGFISYNVNTLEFKETLQFTTAEHAEDFRAGLLSMIDEAANQLGEMIDEQDFIDEDDVKNYNLSPLAREMTKGLLKSFVPTRNDSVLTFESTLKTKTILSNASTSLFLGAVLVQALKSGFAPELPLP